MARLGIVLFSGIALFWLSCTDQNNEIFSPNKSGSSIKEMPTPSSADIGFSEDDEVPSDKEIETAEERFDSRFDEIMKLEKIKGVIVGGLTLLKDNRIAILIRIDHDAAPETENLVPKKIEGLLTVCDRNATPGCWAPSKRSLAPKK